MARAAAFVVTAAVLLAAEGYGVLVHRFGLASNPPGQEMARSSELAGDRSLAQTFQMGAAGFNRLVFHARQAAGPVQGRLVVDLAEIDAKGERPRYQAVLPAQSVADAGRWDLALPEMPDSRGRLYRVTFSLPDTRPGHGLALMVMRADNYPGGTLHVGGREQWGDLVFETGATRAAVWANLEHVVGGPRSWRRPLALAFLALQSLATIGLWFGLVFRRD